jgi:hypothetical protein
MKAKGLVNVSLGITTEIIYALLIILAAFAACLVFYMRA